MSAAHAFDTVDLDINMPLGNYLIAEVNDVMRFLREHPELASLLQVAPNHVERVFGRALPIRLKVFRDGNEPSYSQLLFEIVTGRIGEDAWVVADSALHNLHETWLVSLPRELTRNILFVAEPI